MKARIAAVSLGLLIAVAYAAPVLVYITGDGPTDTVDVKASDAPGAK